MAGRKSRKKKRIIAGITAVCVALVSLGAYTRFSQVRKQRQIDEANQSILSAQATRSTIRSTVIGTGTLSDGEAEKILVPAGIKIDKVLVESGDVVEEGQTLATVNHRSVTKAIREVQSALEDIDDELEDLDTASDERMVKASVPGRIKQIFAHGGDKVSDVMDEHGMLMVMSTDGRMALDIADDGSLSANQRVSVLLSDGSRSSGTVDTVQNGSATVTISDSGKRVGVRASVQDVNGSRTYGEGSLYIHQPYQITASTGTVDQVYVSENTLVDRDDRLLLLDGVNDDYRREELIAEREDLVKTLGRLRSYENNGVIIASVGGVVQDVNLSDDTEVTAVSGSGSVQSSLGLSALSGLPSLAAMGVSYSAQSLDGGVVPLGRLKGQTGAVRLSYADDIFVAGDAGDGRDAAADLFHEGTDDGVYGAAGQGTVAAGSIDRDSGAWQDIFIGGEETAPDPIVGEEDYGADSGQTAPVFSAGIQERYLEGVVDLPIRRPATGSLLMAADELDSLIQLLLEETGQEGCYHAVTLDWIPAGNLQAGSRAIAVVSLKADTADRVYFYPASDRFVIRAPENDGYEFLIQDTDADGRYDEIIVGIAYMVAGAERAETEEYEDLEDLFVGGDLAAFEEAPADESGWEAGMAADEGQMAESGSGYDREAGMAADEVQMAESESGYDREADVAADEGQMTESESGYDREVGTGYENGSKGEFAAESADWGNQASEYYLNDAQALARLQELAQEAKTSPDPGDTVGGSELYPEGSDAAGETESATEQTDTFIGEELVFEESFSADGAEEFSKESAVSDQGENPFGESPSDWEEKDLVQRLLAAQESLDAKKNQEIPDTAATAVAIDDKEPAASGSEADTEAASTVIVVLPLSVTPTEVPPLTMRNTEEGGEPPTPMPAEEPIEYPTATPTQEPTEPATPTPTQEPTEPPTATPTQEPTEPATPTPTQEPTEPPTATPNQEPTEPATPTPTQEPAEQPTATPTQEPVEPPTPTPTRIPFYPVTVTPTQTITPTPTTSPGSIPKLDFTALINHLARAAGAMGGLPGLFDGNGLSSLLAGIGSSGLSGLIGGSGSGLSKLFSSLGSSGLSSLLGGSGLSSLLGSLGGSGLPSLLGGSGSGLSSLLGGSGSGLSSLLGGAGSGSSGLSSLLGGAGSGSSGLSSLLGGSGNGSNGLSSLLGSSGSGNSGLSSLLGSSAGGSGDLASLLGGAGNTDYSSLVKSLEGGAADYQSLANALGSGSGISGLTSGGSSYWGSTSSYPDTTGFTVANNQLMKVTIQVSELDIRSIEAGQLAELTLDALPEESFAGIVTKIASSGKNSGGVTKYPVTLSLLRDERMMSGMSVTVAITIDESENVCVIPADAIHEKLGGTYVYTEKTEEGKLSGEVQVTTGISDSDHVEIVSGISDGQTVYYQSAVPTGLYPFQNSRFANGNMFRQNNNEDSEESDTDEAV